MKEKYIKTALLLGFFAVVLGAFGAHYIADRIAEDSLNAYKTGISYQFYHALLMLIVGFNLDSIKESKRRIIFISLLIGILFFSGSIYLLSTRSLTGLDFISFLGPITPIGGLLLIGSWLMLIFAYQEKQ